MSKAHKFGGDAPWNQRRRGDSSSSHCSVIVIGHKVSLEIKGGIMLLGSLKFTSAGDFYLNMGIECVFISVPS